MARFLSACARHIATAVDFFVFRLHLSQPEALLVDLFRVESGSGSDGERALAEAVVLDVNENAAVAVDVSDVHLRQCV